MATDVIFWVGVKSPYQYHKTKHGDFEYFTYSKESWKRWCKTQGVMFFEYDYEKVGTPNTLEIAATWQRWFDVFRLMDEHQIEFDKIAVVDASSIIHPKTPNFFKLVPNDNLTCFRSIENLRWVGESVLGYQPFFKEKYPTFEFDLKRYFSCGFQIFGESHREFLNKLRQFFIDNVHQILRYQNELVKRGTDQSVYNYLAQIENVPVNLDVLPQRYFLNHLYRFDWFSYNWQLRELNDPTPFFLKYGYIYFYSGFPQRGDRQNLMKQAWDILKDWKDE